MLCAQCGDTTAIGQACAVCGRDPHLDGRYRLEHMLGRGATGATYRATRLVDDVVLAIKEIPLHRADSLKALELFDREARVLRSLRHPKIPAFIDSFTVGLGKQMMLCIAQEFIDGESLEKEIARQRPTERDVLNVLGEVLPILSYLESLRPPLIHRDIKPQNLMRRRDGSLVLIDFGSVRDAIKDSLAGGSTVAGTFGYMAPEQFAGLATPATDIYGLGAAALSLLSGVGAERLIGARGGLDWEHKVSMSPALATLISSMLEPEPARRPTASQASEKVAVLLSSRSARSERAARAVAVQANPARAAASRPTGATSSSPASSDEEEAAVPPRVATGDLASHPTATQGSAPFTGSGAFWFGGFVIVSVGLLYLYIFVRT